MDSKNTHLPAAYSEIFKKQKQKHPCVRYEYYILCKFTWKSYIFIGLQERIF